jgi:hypothetical protein
MRGAPRELGGPERIGHKGNLVLRELIADPLVGEVMRAERGRGQRPAEHAKTGRGRLVGVARRDRKHPRLDKLTRTRPREECDDALPRPRPMHGR